MLEVRVVILHCEDRIGSLVDLLPPLVELLLTNR